MTIVTFLIGLFLGLFLGFGFCAILVAAGQADRDAAYMYEARMREAQRRRDNPLIEAAESQEEPQ